MTYWDGNPEGQRGRFDDGVFNPQSGEVRFGVTVIRRDVQPPVPSKASFQGYLARGGLWGDLRWEGDAAHGRGKDGTEKLNLLMAKGERLESFSTLDAWKKAAAPIYDAWIADAKKAGYDGKALLEELRAELTKRNALQ